MDGLFELGILAVAVVAGLVVLYTVVRLAVRDGVLDARARDDAQLAQRDLQDTMRETVRESRLTIVDEPGDAEASQG